MRAVVILALVVPCGLRVGAFPVPPVTYQPAKVGTKWVYRIEGTKKESATSVVAAEKQGELLVVTIICDDDAGAWQPKSFRSAATAFTATPPTTPRSTRTCAS